MARDSWCNNKPILDATQMSNQDSRCLSPGAEIKQDCTQLKSKGWWKTLCTCWVLGTYCYENIGIYPLILLSRHFPEGSRSLCFALWWRWADCCTGHPGHHSVSRVAPCHVDAQVGSLLLEFSKWDKTCFFRPTAASFFRSFRFLSTQQFSFLLQINCC